jgi:hypothetical protein
LFTKGEALLPLEALFENFEHYKRAKTHIIFSEQPGSLQVALDILNLTIMKILPATILALFLLQQAACTHLET